MKILRHPGLFSGFLALLVLLSGCGSKNYDVKRETNINAPVGTVFKIISHHSEFAKWSPWRHLDPDMVITMEGTDGTVGAKYSWKGNDKAGEGSMTFTKIEDGKAIEQDLHFIKPFESSSQVYMTTEATDSGTHVVWGMRGESGLMERVFMAFMGGMDGAVGKDYEQGLANLKKLCESLPVYEVKDAEWTSKTCLSKRQVVEFKDFGKFFGDNLPKMYEAISKAGAKPGIPLGVYYAYNEEAMNADLAAAVPFEGAKVSSKNYPVLNLPAAKCYTIDYWGDYEKMGPAYEAMTAKLKTMGREHPDMVIEEYITDPMNEKDTAKWNTKIYFFVNNQAAMK